VDSVNVAARYGAPSPARAASEASASILRKAIDTAAQSSEQLIESLPNTGDLAAVATAPAQDAPLPPIGNVGRRLDIRL
jgi:Putative motility protein